MKNRIVYLDIIRITAMFAVIVIHVSSQGWLWNGQIIQQIQDWKIFSIYESFVVWAVPVFIMVSGASMLTSFSGVNTFTTYFEAYKKIFLKIIRLLCALFFWLCVYELFSSTSEGNLLSFSLVNVIKNFFFGTSKYGHFWFIYVIIGLYLVTPLLKRTLQNNLVKRDVEIFLILFVIFGTCVPLINLMLNFFAKSELKFQFVIPELSKYLGYYILGYYLLNYQINKRIKKYIYFLSTLSLFLIIAGTWFFSLKFNYPVVSFFDPLLPFCFVISFAIFILFKDLSLNIKISSKIQIIIESISECSFGIYLIHLLFIALLEKFGIDSISLNHLYSVPVVSFFVFVFSYFTIYLVTKIPVLSKYIV